MTPNPSRRAVVASLGAGVVSLAGCLQSGDSGGDGTPSSGSDGGDDGTAPRDGWSYDGDGDPSDVPTREAVVPLADDLDEFVSSARSGGVDRDGIPSIDEPDFGDADYGDGAIDSGAPVFGVVVDGEAVAYPQRILVWHEIVNHAIGGQPVSITYCPLTGTAIGFERGETTFGVSGRLVNSNLIMYDRATGTWWPQVLATGIGGELRGESLRELPVVWTSWERWREANPDTRVLTADTGFARDYSRDPYGEYNPTRGYYEGGGPMFEVRHSDHSFGQKDVFIGARSRDGALAVEKDRLLSDRLLEATVGGVDYIAVSDPGLATGYVYRDPDGRGASVESDGYRVDGEVHPADALPLDRINAFDAMWFAWAAFYPNTEVEA